MYPQIIFALTFCLIQSLCDELKDLEKVGQTVHVSLLYRHGERTPTWRPSNDPYNDIKYWPQGFGQLTNEGMLHHFRLGQWLRGRYLELIPNGQFRSRTMCTLSTSFDRTIMSAQSSLAGMFPPLPNDTFTDLNWKPVPVHTTPKNADKLLGMENMDCPSYDREVERFNQSEEFIQMNGRFANLYKILSEGIGQPIEEPEQLQNIYSLLLVYEMAGLKLPDWSKNAYPEPLKQGSDFSFTLPAYTTKMKRLKAGPLLKRIIQTFDEKVNNVESRKGKCSNITAYSAHDDVVANFLSTLNVFNGLTPPFAALVALELRKSEANYFVNILYKNETDPFADPKVLKMPNCGVACPFEDFKKLHESVIPLNWDKECNQM